MGMRPWLETGATVPPGGRGHLKDPALAGDLSDPDAVRLCKSRHGHYSTVARLHAIGVRRHILPHGTGGGQSEHELEWLVRIRTVGVPPQIEGAVHVCCEFVEDQSGGGSVHLPGDRSHPAWQWKPRGPVGEYSVAESDSLVGRAPPGVAGSTKIT